MLELGPEKKGWFEGQVKADAEWLKRMGIMDYSLLVGIHDMSKGNRDNLRIENLSVFQVSAQFSPLFAS